MCDKVGCFACWVILHTFCRLLFFLNFQNQLFPKIISGTPSAYQTVWIQIRPDILSGLIWVQTICNGYQQMILVGKELSCMVAKAFHDKADKHSGAAMHVFISFACWVILHAFFMVLSQILL